MKYSYAVVRLCAVMLLISLTALAQSSGDSKRFDKDGLAFNYPNGWAIEDASNQDAQQLTLQRLDLDAQIRFFVHRGKVDTPEKLAQAKTKIVDPYIEATAKTLSDMGGKPTREPSTIEIAGQKAEGMRVKAVVDGVAGEAAIYWLTIGNRLVVLTLFGPDPALRKAAPAWDMVRTSLAVTENKPAQKPAQK
jgi:hypothetical protein